MANHTVYVKKGKGGWGGPLVITPDEKKKYVISVTGGGIHPVAKKIAQMTGTTAVDAFKHPVEREETLIAVIDCGGTARCGTYPRLGIPTANIKLQEPSGPLAKFMTEDIFVSGTTVNDIEFADETNIVNANEESESVQKEETPKQEVEKEQTTSREDDNNNNNDEDEPKKKGLMGLIDKIGRIAGDFINIMYQSGRETIDSIIKNILPFMAFVATIIGIINYTGIGEWIGKLLMPLAGNVVGLVILGLICALPFLSPLLAPGAVIAAIIGTLIGQEIGAGSIPPHFALPALFAIDAQVGMDFIPVGLTLGEAEPETVSIAAPAILFSRVVTGPIAVVIAYFLSFGL